MVGANSRASWWKVSTRNEGWVEAIGFLGAQPKRNIDAPKASARGMRLEPVGMRCAVLTKGELRMMAPKCLDTVGQKKFLGAGSRNVRSTARIASLRRPNWT